MFYKTPAKASANRLKQVLVTDKNEISPVVVNVIKSDITTLLDSYMLVDKDSVFVNFNIDSEGGYKFCITGRAVCTKKVGIYH